MLYLNTTELRAALRLEYARWQKAFYAGNVNQARRRMGAPLLLTSEKKVTSTTATVRVNYNLAVAEQHDKLSAQWKDIAKMREQRVGKLDGEVAHYLSTANYHKELAAQWRVKVNHPRYRQGTV